MFKFKNFNMLDYAHSPAGMRAKNFTDSLKNTYKVGAGIGDRREEDVNENIAFEMFDEIIIRQDKQLRGKPKRN
jgi:cyanophycin synthetase